MKSFLGLIVVVLVFSAPAHAQGGMAIGPGSSASSGGGSFSGGGGLTSSGSRLPSIPPAHFTVAAYSGTEAEFVPSAFMTYEKAIAEGRAALARSKSIAETAAENKNTPRTKAKIALVQDDRGNAVIATR